MADSPILFSRREVMALGAAVAMSPAPSMMSLAAPSQKVPPALDRAMRWFQLALVERDPATFDPDWWLDSC